MLPDLSVTVPPGVCLAARHRCSFGCLITHTQDDAAMQATGPAICRHGNKQSIDRCCSSSQRVPQRTSRGSRPHGSPEGTRLWMLMQAMHDTTLKTKMDTGENYDLHTSHQCRGSRGMAERSGPCSWVVRLCRAVDWDDLIFFTLMSRCVTDEDMSRIQAERHGTIRKGSVGKTSNPAHRPRRFPGWGEFGGSATPMTSRLAGYISIWPWPYVLL